jgi:hypothetical protein
MGEDNVKMNLKEIGCEGEDWIHLAQDKVQWQGHVNMVTNLNSIKRWKGAGIAQWYSAGLGVGNFPLHHHIQACSGSHPASYPVGTRGSFPGGEADHLPPSSAEVKNAWSYTSTPQYAFMAWCSLKAQGHLYL